MATLGDMTGDPIGTPGAGLLNGLVMIIVDHIPWHPGGQDPDRMYLVVFL